MTNGDVAGAESGQPLRGEHLADEPHIPVGGEHAVVIHHDAGTLLSAVLQGIEGVIRQGGHVGGCFRINAEDAAFLMDVALGDTGRDGFSVEAARRGVLIIPHRGPTGAS